MLKNLFFSDVPEKHRHIFKKRINFPVGKGRKMFWNLFCSFFKIGLFTFGGGYAMLPLMQAELVKKHGWITDEELLDYVSLSQCTPGVIAVNMATFVGCKLKGCFGGIVATSAVIAPSLMIISAIASVLMRYMDHPSVVHTFNGIRIVVVALITNILIDLWKKGVKNKLGVALFSVCLALIVFARLTPVMLVISIMLFSVVKQRFWAK